MTGLPVLTDWKRDNHNSIFVIVNWLIKMVHYKPAKITINVLGIVEVIINIIIWHHSLSISIVINRSFLFILKLWSLLCYFFGTKQQRSTTFYLQINGQTKWQNSIIKAYLRAFINFEHNNSSKLLLIVKFAYNNNKNTSTGYISF